MALKQTIRRFRHFTRIGVWKTKLSSLPKTKAILYQVIRVWIITFSEFKKDKITDKASALTYFSLLSFVPVLAMLFGIAKGFGLQEYLMRELEKFFGGQEAILKQGLEWANTMLENADGGIIVGISFLILVYAVLRLMNNIEMAFNDIWDTKSRSWQRKLSDYVAIIMMGPIFIILSSSATVFVTAKIVTLTSEVEVLGYIRPAILIALKLLPYMIIWVLLMILYIIFPNTRVKIIPAIIAGVLAGTLFQLTQWAWIKGQVFLSNYNAIYGAFAVLPLFMIYLQLSWLIVLLGAEVGFAIQNANTWEYKHSGMKMSLNHRKKVTLLILRHIIKNFEMGNKPLNLSELSGIIQIPYRFIRDICRELEEVGVLNRVLDDEVEMYQPAVDVQRIDIFMVLRKLDYKGFDQLKTNEDDIYQEIEKIMEELEDNIKKSPANKLLMEI